MVVRGGEYSHCFGLIRHFTVYCESSLPQVVFSTDCIRRPSHLASLASFPLLTCTNYWLCTSHPRPPFSPLIISKWICIFGCHETSLHFYACKLCGIHASKPLPIKKTKEKYLGNFNELRTILNENFRENFGKLKLQKEVMNGLTI